MSYTAEDAELWETDPYEYIRVKFDVFEDFVSPVTAAQTLLHSICKKRKDALPQTMDMLLKVLQNPGTTPDHKDGALHMIGKLKDKKWNKKLQIGPVLIIPLGPSNTFVNPLLARWLLK